MSSSAPWAPRYAHLAAAVRHAFRWGMRLLCAWGLAAQPVWAANNGGGGQDRSDQVEPHGLRLALSLGQPPSPQRTEAAPATPLPRLLEAAAQTAATSRMADASEQAAQAQRQQAWATAWMPRVQADASTSSQQQRYNGLDSRTPASAVSLSATLPVWRAADRAQVQARQALAEQAFWQARGQRNAVARELCLAYVAAAEAAEQGRLARAQLALLEAQWVVNDKRLRAGVGTVLDQLETRARIEQTRAAIRELAMRARTQQLTIERLGGQPVNVPAGLSDTGDVSSAAAADDALPALPEALQQLNAANPQLLDARAEVTAAHATTRARDAESWQPTLDASASASRTHQTQRFEGASESQNVTTRAVGLQLNWPLFTGGYQQGRTREAAALLSRSQARQDDAESLARTGLIDAYQSLTQSRAMAEAQRDAERAASATLDAVNKAFVAGTRTNLDLLNAQQQVFTARQNLVAARVTALSSHIQILALLDQLDAAHVGPLGALFDPNAMPETAP